MRDNPAFLAGESVAEGSGTGGDGDGDPDPTDDSTTTEDTSTTEPPTGDGDGDEPMGDGDGDEPTGDGDGDEPTGDGDGDEPPECAPDQELCDGVCVLTTDNPDHCGECGNECGEGTECFFDECLYSKRTVFVTSEAYPGDLGGIEGANDICQTHADTAGLVGTYLAWLSSAGLGPADVFNKQGSFVLPDFLQTEVAESWEDLIDGELPTRINRTEYGVLHDFVPGECGVPVWTSVNAAGGSMTGNCEDWTYTGLDNQGRTGSTTMLDERWTRYDGCPFLCEIPHPIYCFQQ